MGGKRLCIRVGWNSVNAHLVTGKGVAQWVSDILRINLDMRVSEGVGWGTQRELFCGIAYTGWNGPNVWFHVAIVRGARMTPTFWAAAMDYPFNQLGVKRISGLIDERNADSRAFATHMGARVEGVLQDATDSGNLILYGLLKKDAQKWLTAPYSKRLSTGSESGQPIQRKDAEPSTCT